MTRLDFVSSGAPLAGWRLALLAIGLLTLLPAAVTWTAQLQAVNHLQARLDAQAALLRPQRLARPALPPAQQQEQDRRMQAIAAAIRQLNLPVTRLLKTVQAPADVRVALLGLDLNGQVGQDDNAGMLKITAEAETAQDMINYLAVLNQKTMFRSVYLLKHETAAGSGDTRPYHFQLEAQWRQ